MEWVWCQFDQTEKEIEIDKTKSIQYSQIRSFLFLLIQLLNFEINSKIDCKRQFLHLQSIRKKRVVWLKCRQLRRPAIYYQAYVLCPCPLQTQSLTYTKFGHCSVRKLYVMILQTIKQWNLIASILYIFFCLSVASVPLPQSLVMLSQLILVTVFIQEKITCCTLSNVWKRQENVDKSEIWQKHY